MRRSIVSLLVGAGLVSGAAAGCGGSRGDDQVTVTRSALTAATDVFGFEVPGDWSTTTAGAVLSQSTTHSQGSFSLQVKPSSSNGFTPIASVPLSTPPAISPTLAWDVMLPKQQPNPSWFGTAQMYLNCPSRNIFSAFLGQVELTGKPLNVWNTISFPLTNAQITSLLQAGYTDLTVTVVLNVPVPTTGVYLVDNLRFIPLAANACGGRPTGTLCTDGNACTQTDTCQAGLCQGANPVVCAAPDQCHTAGACNTSTGVCSNPTKANGTICNDGNACTQADACQAGVCTGGNPIVCPSVNQCNVGVCDPTSGACAVAAVANGTACNDGQACTSGDTCQSGVCGGALDSLCQISIRFEEIVALGSGARTAIFSYTNPGTSTVSAAYGSSNFISVNGQMVATPSPAVPTSFTPGDHPGALSYPLPAGATTVAWTLGPHQATSSGAAKPLGTTSTGAPAVTVTTAAGSPLVVSFDTTNADVSTAVVFTVNPSTLSVPQGGQAAVTLNVEYVGPDAADFSNFSFVETDVSPPGGPGGLSDRLLPEGSQTPVSAFEWVFQADPAALLGDNNIFLTVGNPVPGQPSVSLTVTVVPPVVSTVALASLSLTAPLTMQGVPSWAGFANIDNDISADEVIEPFLNYTSTPLPPFLSDPNAPRWVKGSGFTVQDDLGLPAMPSSVPKVIVASAQVSFEVGVSLTDDTSALAMTATADTFNDQINVGTGITSCTSSLFPSVVEGNHGKYTVRIERWDDTATNCPAPEHLDPDYPNDGVMFDGPSPDAHAGCWVAVNSTTTDLYSSQPLPDIKGAGINGQTAPKDGTFQGLMTVPVTLPAIATFLRYVVKLEEADTRVPNDTDVVGWNNNRRYPDAFSCEEKFNFSGITPFTPLTTPTTGQGYSCPIGNDPNNFLWDAYVPFCPPAVPHVIIPGENSNEGPLAIWRFTRPLVSGQPQQQTFVYEQAFNPFEVVIEPVAVAQMKVLPYTILYQPPGDKSTATYTMTTSYGTTITAQSALEQDQATTIENKDIEGGSFGDDFAKNFLAFLPTGGGGSSAGGGAAGGGMSVTNFLKGANLSLGFTVASSTTWDDTTKVGSGTTTTAATIATSTFQAVTGFTLQKVPSLVPGATGTYAGAPFWGDRIMLLVHPQVGIWQANGQNAIILLGAQGNGPTFEPTVSQLDACARQVAPYQNGLPIDTSSHRPLDSSDVLDANDCLQLLQLDPFYGVGQSLPSAPTARILAAQNQPVGTDYGIAPSDPTHPGPSELSVTVSDMLTYAAVTTNTKVATYSTTVTDVVTSTDTDTATLSFVGLSAGLNSSAADSTGKANNWTLTYQQSFAATAQSSILFSALLDDDHAALPASPTAFIFQDAVFGGFMFQDPNAPLAP